MKVRFFKWIELIHNADTKTHSSSSHIRSIEASKRKISAYQYVTCTHAGGWCLCWCNGRDGGKLCLLKITKRQLWNQFIYDEAREMRVKWREKNRFDCSAICICDRIPGWALDLNNNSSFSWNCVLVDEFCIWNEHRFIDPVFFKLFSHFSLFSHFFALSSTLRARVCVSLPSIYRLVHRQVCKCSVENSFFFLQFFHIIEIFFASVSVDQRNWSDNAKDDKMIVIKRTCVIRWIHCMYLNIYKNCNNNDGDNKRKVSTVMLRHSRKCSLWLKSIS